MTNTIDLWEIPDFLKLKKGDRRPVGKAKVLAMPVTPSAWARIQERKKLKARARIGKMKAVLADRQALKDGKTWDVVRGGWR